MKSIFTILLIIILHNIAFSQTIKIKEGVYYPENYNRYDVGDKKTRLKSLSLNRDSSFYFQDFTHGSCWLWHSASGKWKINNNTLVLEWKYKPLNTEIPVLVTKYIISGQKLLYSDPNEKNIIVNWGTFTVPPNKKIWFSKQDKPKKLKQYPISW